jgi:Arginase family.
MQPSLFENILTCGCWVKMALDNNPFLHRVALMGTDDRLLQNIDSKYKGRVVAYSENSLHHAETWKKFASIHFQYPVYVSVDKDVLNPKEEITNWDQGGMKLSELESLLAIILKHSEVIGIDVSGACPMTMDGLSGNRIIDKDEHVNLELLKFLKETNS